MSVKETEKQMSNIVQLLHEANKPADSLAIKMGKAAENLEFEKAAQLRDEVARINAQLNEQSA